MSSDGHTSDINAAQSTALSRKLLNYAGCCCFDPPAMVRPGRREAQTLDEIPSLASMQLGCLTSTLVQIAHSAVPYDQVSEGTPSCINCCSYYCNNDNPYPQCHVRHHFIDSNARVNENEIGTSK